MSSPTLPPPHSQAARDNRGTTDRGCGSGRGGRGREGRGLDWAT